MALRGGFRPVSGPTLPSDLPRVCSAASCSSLLVFTVGILWVTVRGTFGLSPPTKQIRCKLPQVFLVPVNGTILYPTYSAKLLAITLDPGSSFRNYMECKHFYLVQAKCLSPALHPAHFPASPVDSAGHCCAISQSYTCPFISCPTQTQSVFAPAGFQSRPASRRRGQGSEGRRSTAALCFWIRQRGGCRPLLEWKWCWMIPGSGSSFLGQGGTSPGNPG